MQAPLGELTVRIYTFARAGRWYAEVPKLSLMTEGSSEEEAVHSLIEQTVAYVRTVVTRGWFDRLYRPVSFPHRAGLWARVALAKLRLQSAHRRSELVRIQASLPRNWPPLTAKEIGDCLTALGWIHDHDESSHQLWVNETTHQVVAIDVKWSPVSGPLLKHIVTEQMGISRLRFYGATKATSRKIGLR